MVHGNAHLADQTQRLNRRRLPAHSEETRELPGRPQELTRVGESGRYSFPHDQVQGKGKCGGQQEEANQEVQAPHSD